MPLTDACILKFDDSGKVYLCYKEQGVDKPVLRHIPNPNMQQAWGLFGEVILKPGKERAVNYIERSLLTHSTKLQHAPANNDIVEIRCMLDIDKCLDIAGNDTDIMIHATNGDQRQRWKLSDAGDGYHYIESLMGQGKMLDVKGGGTADGTGIIAFPGNRCDNQKWKIVPADATSGLFYLVPKHAPASCLDLAGFKRQDGAALILHNRKAGDDRSNQVWYFHKVG